MILATKGFRPGLIATLGKGEYKYHPGKNTTEAAKCASTGFHCCKDPLDCLCYYPWDGENEFWAVWAGGDIDEDGQDSRISCTELTLIRRLYIEEMLLLHGEYVFGTRLSEHKDIHRGPFHVVHGYGKSVKGSQIGDWLCIICCGEKECNFYARQVDGITYLPGVEYTAEELQ